MSDLVAVTYPDEYRAAEVLAVLRRLQASHLIDLDDAVYVTKNQAGEFKLHQSVSLTGAGAVSGGFWGLLVGAIFSIPVMIVAPGVALATAAATTVAGAGVGALAGHFTDYGIDDQFIKDLSAQMQPGSSALFVLVRNVTPDRVLDEVSKFGGTVLRTSLSKEADAKLQAALDAGSGAASAAKPAADA